MKKSTHSYLVAATLCYGSFSALFTSGGLHLYLTRSNAPAPITVAASQKPVVTDIKEALEVDILETLDLSVFLPPESTEETAASNKDSIEYLQSMVEQDVAEAEVRLRPKQG